MLLGGALALIVYLLSASGAPAVARAAISPARSADSPTAAPTPDVVLDEHFKDAAGGWPDQVDTPAWYADAEYHLQPRVPGQFVAVDAPNTDAFHDGVVSATFEKLGGPPGGGYGLIVADQGPEPHDGVYQGGHFLVFEAGDEGTVGVWERADNHWVDIVPWTPASAVHSGAVANDVQVQAAGQQLSFRVNGIEVAHVTNGLAPGRIGVFVGGDGNDVALQHFKAEWALGAPGALGAPMASVQNAAGHR
jgi:hypothetical protein